MTKMIFPLLAVVMLLSACASKTYTALSGTVNVQPEEVLADENAWLNSRVQWGGKVLSLYNEAKFSRIEILMFPLDDNGRPSDGLAAGRRFFAYSKGYLESRSYPVGTLITVNGTIDGVKLDKIGLQDYRYVVLQANDMTTWAASVLSRPTVHFGIGIGIGR